MTVKSYVFGHPVFYKNGWKYVDNSQSVGSEIRKCPRCQRFQTVKGHDPCIRDLKDVKSACCGHGVEPGYFIQGSIPGRSIKQRGNMSIEDQRPKVTDLYDLPDGCWGSNTVEELQDAIKRLLSEPVYEEKDKNNGISVRFLARINALRYYAELEGLDNPLISDAQEILGDDF